MKLAKFPSGRATQARDTLLQQLLLLFRKIEFSYATWKAAEPASPVGCSCRGSERSKRKATCMCGRTVDTRRRRVKIQEATRVCTV
jgi:hypothetical protein